MVTMSTRLTFLQCVGKEADNIIMKLEDKLLNVNDYKIGSVGFSRSLVQRYEWKLRYNEFLFIKLLGS